MRTVSRFGRLPLASRAYRWTCGSRAIIWAAYWAKWFPGSIACVPSAATVIEVASGWRAPVLQVASATTIADTRSGARRTTSWARLPPRLSPTSTTRPAGSASSRANTSCTAASKSKLPVDSPWARRSGTTSRKRSCSTSTCGAHARWSRVAPCSRTTVGPVASPPVQ